MAKTDEEIIEELITAIDPSGDAKHREQWRGEAERALRMEKVFAKNRPKPEPAPAPATGRTVGLIRTIDTNDPELQQQIDAWAAEWARIEEKLNAEATTDETAPDPAEETRKT